MIYTSKQSADALCFGIGGYHPQQSRERIRSLIPSPHRRTMEAEPNLYQNETNGTLQDFISKVPLEQPVIESGETFPISA